MPIQITNTENYIFNFSYNAVPSIEGIQTSTITLSQFDEVAADYLTRSQTYVDNFRAEIEVRDSVKDRLGKDLAAQSKYLTQNGINKQENSIILHAKADNVFNVAVSDKNLQSTEGIISIANQYDMINEQLVLNDEKNNSALVLDGEYLEEQTYDTQAKTISVSSVDYIFIKVNPSATGNNRTFASYSSELNSSTNKYDNTIVYTINFQDYLTVNDNEFYNVWVVKNAEGNILYYTTESIDNVTNWIQYND